MASNTGKLAQPPTEPPTVTDASTEETFYVKWDVDNGGDRTHYPYAGFDYDLEGSPKIQGVEIGGDKETVLKLWTGQPTDVPDKQVPGPTGGKVKITSTRYSSYRLDYR